jgi:hypothetical protein
LLLNHLEATIAKSSLDLRQGVMPSDFSYLNIIVTTCLSKQHNKSPSTKDFCYAYAYDLMKTRNEKNKQFKLNGFIKANTATSDMPNLIQRKVSKRL